MNIHFLSMVTLFLSCWAVTGFINGCKHTALQSEHTALKGKNKQLETALSSQQKKSQQLERDNASLKIQILEYESLIKDLQDRSSIHQQRLDAAIVEVVRSKARMHSIESKAEAASTIAEAEIAVNGLKKQVAANDAGAHVEIAKADQLLSMSAIEFKSRNFGGALYLASQAKRQAQTVQLRLTSTKKETLEGETLFVQQLPLKCLKNTNLRRGPGVGYEIIGTLAKGTLVMGYSYKESWVRVETQGGRSGWLYQSLVGTR